MTATQPSVQQNFKYKDTFYAIEMNDFEECVKMVEAGYRLLPNGLTKYTSLSRWDPDEIDFVKKFCVMVAEYGNIPFLKWLREKGCLWSEDVTTAASSCGQLETIKYCIENGCEYNIDRMTFFAIANGHVECVKYLFTTYNAAFWKNRIKGSCSTKFLAKIDLDDKEWRKLFECDLSTFEDHIELWNDSFQKDLKQKVDAKLKLINKTKSILMEQLGCILPTDVIKYCIYPFV